ncbi:MAG: aldehyde dehydrogenase family protein [Desulfobacterales bacterium]
MEALFETLNLKWENPGGFCGEWIASGKTAEIFSPINGESIGKVINITEDDYKKISEAAYHAFLDWREVPAPKRGEIVRQLGNELREKKDLLGRLVTLEMGKSIQEGYGEVQEMIDICDFAVGMSRQLCGVTISSERKQHRMFEQWHPLGVVGVITAFNFPVAVWSWNAALALICGDSVIWKPSSKTPLTAIAVIKIMENVLRNNNFEPALCSLAVAPGGELGDRITKDKNVALISYTGSVKRGREVGKIVQERFGKLILELGGNNAVIISNKANLDIALKSVYFGAIGTSGQRCTSTRRVIVHEEIYDTFLSKLKSMYQKTSIGDPRDQKNIMGPLVDKKAVDVMMEAIESIKKEGGNVLYGGEKTDLPGGCYVTPCLVEADRNMKMLQKETFAPILYVLKYNNLEEAINIQNDVPQGLSSAIITDDLIESELYLSCRGSDCGISNVNIGTSGAEIGGAFGGEKETGGGRTRSLPPAIPCCFCCSRFYR